MRSQFLVDSFPRLVLIDESGEILWRSSPEGLSDQQYKELEMEIYRKFHPPGSISISNWTRRAPARTIDRSIYSVPGQGRRPMGLRTPLVRLARRPRRPHGRFRRLGHARPVHHDHRRTYRRPHRRRPLRRQPHGPAFLRRAGCARPHSARLHQRRRDDEGRPGPLRPDLQRTRRRPRRRARLPLAVWLCDGGQRRQPGENRRLAGRNTRERATSK